MQVTETSAEGLKRELKIVIPAKDIENRIDAKLQEVGERVRVPGFRPGKVPSTVLKQRFGDAVKGEALEEVVSEGVRQTLDDKKMRPAMQPKVDIDKFEDGKDLEVNLALELLPDIEPVDFSGLELTRYKVKVPDSEVEDALKRVAEQQKSSEPVKEKRAAKEGDIVVIDFVGKLGGEPFDGGAAEDYQLEIGSGTFIPGFEEQLVGAEPDTDKQVTLTFPEDYGAEQLAGKEVTFDVKVKELREPVPAAINEDLAKNLGQNSLDDLRKLVREQIENDYSSLTRDRLKRDLLDRLAEAHDFAVPEGMVDAEFEGIWQQFQEHREQHQDHDHDHEDKDKTDDELRVEYRDIAERRVRLGLLLSDVGNKNEVSVSQEEVGRAVMQEAQRFPGQERQVMEYFQQNEQAMQQIRAPIFEQKVVDFIVELAKVKEREVTPEELAKLASEDEAEEKQDEAKPKKKAASKSKGSGKSSSKSGQKGAKSGGSSKSETKKSD